MRPKEDLRKRRRHMTQRQIERRKNVPVDKASDISLSRLDECIVQLGGKSKLVKDENEVIITISNSDLMDISIMDIEKALNLVKAPKLLSQSSDISSIYKLVSAKRRMLHIALYMNNIGHYSGGRYYLVFLAYMLAQMGHKVTILSDKRAFFLDDFKFLDVENRVEWYVEKFFHKTKGYYTAEENPFDYVIESPLANMGFLYADKWKIPLYACLFESPNFVRKYRGGADSTEEYWSRYKQGILNFAQKLMSISKESCDSAIEWLETFKGKYEIVVPCINTWAADRVACNKEENEVVFVGRHVEFKNPDGIIFAVAKIPEDIRPTINYVGSHSAKLREKMMTNATAVDVNIRFYANVNDLEKFYIIKRSKMMIFPTVFEGAGIPPAEALYCKKPCITYDIPVLRREYKDYLDYAKYEDMNDVARIMEMYLRDDELRIKRGEYGYSGFFNQASTIPYLPTTMRKALKRVFYNGKDLSITAGIIVLNGRDTIRLALRSIYDFVDKIVIVEGAVEDYARVNSDMVFVDRGKPKQTDYDSIDGTFEEIAKCIDEFDPYGKIEVVPPPDGRYWKNKAEMQNAIAERIDTDLYLKVDSDEIFTESDVEYLKRHFILDERLTCIQILKHEFWKSLKTVAIGGQWFRPQARMWRWREDFRHPVDGVKTGFNFYRDKDGNDVKPPKYKFLNLMEKLCYHLGHARDSDQVRAKINYYANRGIEQNVTDNFTNWKVGDPTNSTNPVGTTAEAFTGKLPPVLREGYFDKVYVSPKERYENNVNILNSPKKNMKEVKETDL